MSDYPGQSRQPLPYHRAGLLAGLTAGAVVTLGFLLLSRVSGISALSELLGYRIIALIPLDLFSTLLATFGSGAKQLLLVGTSLGQVLLCGVLGLLWASCAEPLPHEARSTRRCPAFWSPTARGGLLFALFLYILCELLVLGLLGAGVFGVYLPGGAGPTAIVLAAGFAGYGLLLAACYQRLLRITTAPAGNQPLTRRQLLAGGLAALGVLLVSGLALLFRRQATPQAQAAPAAGRVGNNGLPPAITPTNDFYQVSKNFADPKVAEAGWTLQIGGMVEHPYTLTLADIRALPAVTETRTLCCISNEVGGDLISNATWQGVRLRDLLDRAGVKAGAVDLAIGAHDGYTDSIPINTALNGNVLAVYAMNDEPLSDKHGFPVRLLVPDIYGMKNVKWVTKLDVVPNDVQGYWEAQGWSDVATVKTMSRFDFPRSFELLPTGPNKFGGVAFAGARGIKQVEVSTDSGQTWQEARLRQPLGPYTWVLWSATIPLTAGEHTLLVRATDGTGAVQTDRPRSPLPDGATGWATIRVRVAAGVPAPIINGGDA